MARGMVVGEPIVSQAQTKAFDEGYERTFGERPANVRGRYVYVAELGRCVKVGEDWRPTDAERVPVVGDSHYDGLQATDGTDISTRTRHREYMRRHGLTTVDDFTETFKAKAKEREAYFTEDRGPAEESKHRRETIGRAIYELEKKGKFHG